MQIGYPRRAIRGVKKLRRDTVTVFVCARVSAPADYIIQIACSSFSGFL